MTRVYLVRHGETEWNRIGKLQGKQHTTLNALGREQAEMTGAYLKQGEVTFDILVTSPLQRAKETAEIINRYLQIPLIEIADLQERGFGIAEGMAFKAREQTFPDGNFPGSEREGDFHKRVVTCFGQITERFRGKNILIISHGLVIQLILSVVSGHEINYQQTELRNGSLNVLQRVGDNWRVQQINLVDHLDRT